MEVPEFEDWLSHTSYNEARKLELRQAHEQLRGQAPSRRARSHIDSFPKLESYPCYKEARWINSRSDAFKVYSGPAFHAIEEELYRHKWFIKHVPVPERPALIKALARAGLRYYENDFKAFESHFTAKVMRQLELRLYRHCLKSYPELAEVICSTLSGVNRLHTKAKVNINLEARRMSGDMCTSLGNGFSNLMIALFIAHLKGGTLDGFVEGDDGLFATDIEMTAEDYLRLGFRVEIKEVSDPSRAHFCGMTMTSDNTIIKDPRRIFQTFGWTGSFIHAGDTIMDGLLRSKALSLAYELPQCPVVGALARVSLELTEGVQACAESTRAYRPIPDEFRIDAFSPTMEARKLVEECFGISVETQILAEKAIASHDMLSLSMLIPAVRGSKPTEADVFNYTMVYTEVT